MNPKLLIQALLFRSPSPVKLMELAKMLDLTLPEVQSSVKELMQEMNIEDSALHLVLHDKRLEMVTNPALASVLPSNAKAPQSGELTSPQLEAVTIIAYKGPVSKAEIEHIRGINCSVIVRNLLIRGIIEEVKSANDILPRYQLTHDALAHMGIHSMSELPNYEEHTQNVKIDELIDAIEDYD